MSKILEQINVELLEREKAFKEIDGKKKILSRKLSELQELIQNCLQDIRNADLVLENLRGRYDELIKIRNLIEADMKKEVKPNDSDGQCNTGDDGEKGQETPPC